MNYLEYLAEATSTDLQYLKEFEEHHNKILGTSGVLETVVKEMLEKARSVRDHINAGQLTSDELHQKLRAAVLNNERELIDFLVRIEGKNDFERAATLARKIVHTGRGYFLKKDFGKEILLKSPPENLMKFFNYQNVDQLFAKHDVTEIFSALRFMETNEWMHQTFEVAYSEFTSDDFEDREVEIRVLGPEWYDVAAKYVAKKHHNVSHLKEFGVIFLNPIGENIAGKFIRDFNLLLHYFHEIEFYSKLFRLYSNSPDFARKLKMLLRGDIRQASILRPHEWLITQRYLFKEDPTDPRLKIPRVNPESNHWRKGELDLSEFGQAENLGVAMWGDLDWVGIIAEDDGRLISFDLEDNAMSAVTYAERRAEYYSYHQREALWNKIFRQFFGPALSDKLLLDNFDRGVISVDHK